MFGWLSASRLKHDDDDDFWNNYYFKHEDQSGGIVIKFANKWKKHDTKDYVVGKSSHSKHAVLQRSNSAIFTVDPS